jgi:hypothetical protein
MYDFTLHAKTLARQYRKSDFQPGLLYIPVSDKEIGVQRAVALTKSGFHHLALHRSRIGGKNVYQHRSIEQALIIRHISENLRRITGVKQSDRQMIVKGAAQICSSGLAFTIVKLDIKSFYETIHVTPILESLEGDAAFSRQSISLLSSFFEALVRRNIVGLPRGLGLSATLAEYAMRPFDRTISSLSGVWYYSRFVDDVLLVLAPSVSADEIRETAQHNLPEGLVLSRQKTSAYSFSSNVSAGGGEEHAFAYLGYQVSIGRIERQSDNRLKRIVKIDIANSKVRKIKTRIARSLHTFNSNGDYDDLLDRIRLLTSNYGLEDYDTGQTRYVGVRYNYPLIALPSPALSDLDKYLLNALTNTHPNNRIRPNLSASQRRRMTSLTFTSGFQENRFFTFSPERVGALARCWTHA